MISTKENSARKKTALITPDIIEDAKKNVSFNIGIKEGKKAFAPLQ